MRVRESGRISPGSNQQARQQRSRRLNQAPDERLPSTTPCFGMTTLPRERRRMMQPINKRNSAARKDRLHQARRRHHFEPHAPPPLFFSSECRAASFAVLARQKMVSPCRTGRRTMRSEDQPTTDGTNATEDDGSAIGRWTKTKAKWCAWGPARCAV